MARFLERYVHAPLEALLDEEPAELPDQLLAMSPERVTIRVGKEEFSIARDPQSGDDEEQPLPDDVDEQVGP